MAEALEANLKQIYGPLAYIDKKQSIMVGDSAFKKAKDLWDRLTKAATEAAKKAARELESQLLLKAFRAFADIHRQTFDVNREDAEYLTPAQAAAERGFKVVIFGHTHLVKRVGLNKEGAVYLNTGTWADLMKVPEAILSGDKTKAKQQLVGFLKDLEGGNLRDWRCQVPTFARVDMESGKPVSADVYVFNGPRRVQRVRDGRLSQLDHKKTV
jgi:predicted phosphodiesterase